MDFKKVLTEEKLIKRVFYRASCKLITAFRGYPCTKPAKKTDFYKDEDKYREQILSTRKYGDISISLWPKGYDVACNIQFDDFCPKSNKQGEFDNGGIPGNGTALILEKLIKKFSFIKMTLFTIPESQFVKKALFNEKYGTEFLITNPVHSAWLSWIRSKEFVKTVEIASHGLHHYQSDVPFCWPAEEFAYKDEQECISALKESKKIFAHASLKPEGIRTAAYSLGKNKSVIDAIKKEKFLYMALSSPTAGLNARTKTVSNCYPTFVKNVLNLPENIAIKDLEAKNKIDYLIRMNGILAIKGHCILGTEWLASGLDDKNINNLYGIIDYLDKTYPKRVWFAKLEEIAKWWIATSSLKVWRSNKSTYIKNCTKYEIKDLVVNINQKKKTVNIAPNGTVTV